MTKSGGCCGNGRNPMARQAIFGGNTVECTTPESSFSTEPNPATGDSPTTIAFTDTSLNTPTSWLWVITGGIVNVDYVYTSGSETAQNPVIRFDTVGSYSVVLTATNACGSDDSIAHTVTVNFAPSSITGLLGWYNMEAANLTKDGSDNISQVNDLSGNSRHLIQPVGAAQPLWVNSVLNSKPVSRYSGSPMGLYNLSMPLTQPYTIFIVGKNTVNNSSFLSLAPADVEFDKFANTFKIYAGTFLASSPLDNTFHILTGIYHGATSQCYFDGTAGGVANAGTDGGTEVYIGNYQGTASQQMAGDIAEIVIYNGHLSAPNIALVNGYLNNKYAVY